MMTVEPSRHGPAPSRTRARTVRDAAIRGVGIPFFGLMIPRLMGNFHALGGRDSYYWIGTGWFLVLSFALWQGNRRLVLRRSARPDWLAAPGRNLAELLFAHVLLSVPVTVAALALWYLAAPVPVPEWWRIPATTGVVVIAVLFVAHAYETTFLIQDRLEDRLHLERVERARLQAELGVMRSQLTPHFLFNCLNSLGVLIEEDPATARRYNQHMARVCRHLIGHQARDLVPLAEEWTFFEAYAALARLRFPAGLKLTTRGFEPGALAGFLIPPASLQVLLENALKHNAFGDHDPLPVDVLLHGDAIVVRNPIRSPSPARLSTGTGLANLRERFQLIVRREVMIDATGGSFRVCLPLVRESERRDD